MLGKGECSKQGGLGPAFSFFRRERQTGNKEMAKVMSDKAIKGLMGWWSWATSHLVAMELGRRD